MAHAKIFLGLLSQKLSCHLSVSPCVALILKCDICRPAPISLGYLARILMGLSLARAESLKLQQRSLGILRLR